MSISFEEYNPECCDGSLPWIKEPATKENENKCPVCGKVLEAGESHYNTGASYCNSVRSN